MNTLELTFAILKPHIVKHPVALEKINNTILTSNFKIVMWKRCALTLQEAEAFYRSHMNKFFYNRLVTFMISGPSDLYILAREDAIKKWRQLMGPTKVFRAQFEAPMTIRGQFGLSDTRNASHGSGFVTISCILNVSQILDSPESANSEISIFFPEFNVQKWYEEQEPKFRLNQISFIKENFVHKVIESQ